MWNFQHFPHTKINTYRTINYTLMDILILVPIKDDTIDSTNDKYL